MSAVQTYIGTSASLGTGINNVLKGAYEHIGKGTVAANWGGPIDVTQSPYNAKFDNTTDDTAAIQAALNDASLAWYGLTGNDQVARVVQLPPGRAIILGTLSLPTNVWLRGQGKSATYLYKSGAITTHGPVIKLAAGGVQVKLSDFGIISTDNGATAGAAIDLTGGNNPSILGDQVAVVTDVVIEGHYDGLVDQGTENRYTRVLCYNQQRTGISIGSTDSHLTDCTVANYGQVNKGVAYNTQSFGFSLAGTNCMVTGCKAFGGVLATSGQGGDQCPGFELSGSGRHTVVNCQAQDNGGTGFEIAAQNCAMIGCLSDSNNWSGFSLGSAPVSVVGCVVMNRGGAYTTTQAIISPSAGTVVRGMVTSNVRRFNTGQAQVSGCILEVDNRFGEVTAAYAATITPDPWLGGVVNIGTITGAITIANPQSNPTNGADGTSAWYQQGQELDLVLPQDATGGRTVTFGTFYKTTGAIPTTASSVTQIKFRYDGTNWREVSRATT